MLAARAAIRDVTWATSKCEEIETDSQNYF